MIIQLKNLSKKFGNEVIFSNLNLSIPTGQLTTIFSGSGKGKTTLLRLIAGLEKPTSGEIFLHKQQCFSQKINIAPQQRNVGFVFQNYALFNHLPISKNITFGVKDKKRKSAILEELAETFKIKDILNKFPYQISGGQQQRVAIARSLAPSNDILLLDEPFSNLDEQLKSEIATFLKKIFKDKNVTALLVTHSKIVAKEFSDKIFTLEELCSPSLSNPTQTKELLIAKTIN